MIIKSLAYFGIGLIIFQVVNLFGNIVRLVPEWQVIGDFILYCLVAIALLICIVSFGFCKSGRIDLGICILSWVGAVSIPLFYAAAFDLAWLDTVIK